MYRLYGKPWRLLFDELQNKKEKQLDLLEWVGMKELIIKALTIDAVCIHIKEMHNQKVFCWWI